MSFCSQAIPQLELLKNQQTKVGSMIAEYSKLKDEPIQLKNEYLLRFFADRSELKGLLEYTENALASERLRFFDEKCVSRMEYYFLEEKNQKHIAEGMAGLDSDRAWNLRHRLIGAAANTANIKAHMAIGLAGLDCDRAWLRRYQFINEGIDEGCLVIGLAGVDSGRAWEMRDSFLEKSKNFMTQDKSNAISYILRSLVGLDSDRAWNFRESLLRESLTGSGQFDFMVLNSIVGLDSGRAWEIREQVMGKYGESSRILDNLAGIDSERAWKLREYMQKQVNSDSSRCNLAMSLIGLNSDRAWQMREQLFEQATINDHNWPRALAGLDSERAWQWREKFIERGFPVRDNIFGLSGNDLNFAWRLRLKQKLKKAA